ncbi:MAG: phage tail protein [Chroococcales cyanobacterium]
MTLLNLRLTPMQLSETRAQPVVSQSGRPMAEVSQMTLQPANAKVSEIIIYPGEPSEIVVEIENLSDTPLYLEIQVEGDFPAQWCRIGQEGNQLPPHSKMEAVLYFQVPANLFEAEDALAEDSTLKLDYFGQCLVSYAQSESDLAEPELLKAASFILYLRPRSLYLNFVPDLYRQVDFIGRLLKIFEQAFEPAVDTLDSLWAYLNPLIAPESLLPFLGYWVGWSVPSHRDSKLLTSLPNLPIERQRTLISQALQIYRWRGTKRGLRFYLHLYTNLPLDEHLPERRKHISIEEVFGQGFVVGETRMGQGSTLGGGRPYHFIVSLRAENPTTIDESLVRQIIEQEKPAFCTYDLLIDSFVNSSE